MTRATQSRTSRSTLAYGLLVVAGVSLVLGALAFRTREARHAPPSRPAQIHPATRLSKDGSSSGEARDPKASLQEIREMGRAIKENVGKISDNVDKLSEDPLVPRDTAPKTGSRLNESVTKLRTQMEEIAAATEPGGKVDTILSSLQRTVAPDGPLATNLKAAEEKTAELVNGRKAPPKSTPKRPGNR